MEIGQIKISSSVTPGTFGSSKTPAEEPKVVTQAVNQAEQKVPEELASKAAVMAMAESASLPEELQQAIADLQDTAMIFDRRLSFRVDEPTQRVVVNVIDTTTNEIIREIPPERVLEIAARLREFIGMLVDERV